MKPPTEADGWRVEPDPHDDNAEFGGYYWRCRALTLEFNFWLGGRWLIDWQPAWLRPASSATVNVQERTPEREALWADLYYRP